MWPMLGPTVRIPRPAYESVVLSNSPASARVTPTAAGIAAYAAALPGLFTSGLAGVLAVLDGVLAVLDGVLTVLNGGRSSFRDDRGGRRWAWAGAAAATARTMEAARAGRRMAGSC